MTDSQNQRAMIWDGVPLTNGAPADFILGQSSDHTFHNQRVGADGKSLFNPGFPALKNGKLAVPVSSLAQALIFDVTTGNNPSASRVVGQPNVTSSEKNLDFGLLSGARFSAAGMAYFRSNQSLFVGEGSNDRILVWENLPTTDGQSADVVIGSSSFTSKTGPGTLFNGAFGGICENSTQFFVSDPGPSRIVVFDASWMAAKTNGPTGSFAIGQPSIGSALGANQGGSPSSKTLNLPYQIVCDDDHLWVADQLNHRVLRYTLPITSNDQAADLVLGQRNFTSGSPNSGDGAVHAQGFDSPIGIAIGDGKLFVADTQNNRILVWDSIPQMNFEAPSRVLGQSDFSSNGCNRHELSVSIETFCEPKGLSIDQHQLAVSDTQNARVLILPLD